jgi:chromosome segregation protein
LEQESGDFDTFVQQSAQQMLGLKEQVRDSQAQDLVDEQEIEQTKVQLENCRRELAIKQERYQSNEEQLAMKKKEIDSLTQNIRQFEKVQESYRQSALEAEELQKKLNGAASQQTTLVNTMINEAEQLKQRMQSLTAEVEAIGAEIQGLNKKATVLNEGLAPLQTKLEIGQEKIRNIELRQVRLETELEGLAQQWQDKFNGEDPALYNVLASSRQVREYKLTLDELRDQLEQLGPVDIEAIKEYDDVKARYEFLRRQIADLSAAKVSLQNLLEETERIMARNFIQFIGLAEASFQKTFREIFNGGDAALSLESMNDLNCGVDLTVKMPGKRNQSLNLLSGGERALTCIAFIFALLRLKPAPFCLLDEIDASLDETNLIRFTDFLRNMAGDTQFIVVTHRQATIEAGNNIYGITMPEEGISSVLSIRSEQMESMAV